PHRGARLIERAPAGAAKIGEASDAGPVPAAQAAGGGVSRRRSELTDAATTNSTVIAWLERSSIPEAAVGRTPLLRLHPCEPHRRHALYWRHQRSGPTGRRAQVEAGRRLHREIRRCQTRVL